MPVNIDLPSCTCRRGRYSNDPNCAIEEHRRK